MTHMTQSAPERKMPGGLFARRKVMMIPTFGRDEQASRFPIDAHEFAARRPHQRVAPAGDDDDLRAGSMAMCFFISSGLDRHDVPDHRISRKMNSEPAETDPTFRVRIERDGVQILNKIH